MPGASCWWKFLFVPLFFAILVLASLRLASGTILSSSLSLSLSSSLLPQNKGEAKSTHASGNPNPPVLLAEKWISDAVLFHCRKTLSSAPISSSPSSSSLFWQSDGSLRQIIFTGAPPSSSSSSFSSSPQSSGRLRQKLFTGIPSSSFWWSFGDLKWKRTKLLNDVPCTGILEHYGYEDTCAFVKNTEACRSKGLLNYFEFFYCTCQRSPGLGYAALLFWLPVLFFVLARTSAGYFCCTLQRLSTLMKLTPAVSGVTLLALGNGAPDVFSGLAAFTGSGGSVQGSSLGVSGILGGAAFVTMLVSGSVALVAPAGVNLEWQSICCNLGFLFLSTAVLWVIISDGRVYLSEAICFLLLYVAYTTCVIFMELLDCSRRRAGEEDKEEGLDTHQPFLPEPIPQSHGNNDDAENPRNRSLMVTIRHFLGLFYVYLIQFPLPLHLTIPIVEEDRWHRLSAIIGIFLAPSLIALVWMGDFRPPQSIINATPILVGAGLGVLACFTTEPNRPPQYLNFAWVVIGFAMSITWFYLTSQELLEVLVAMGTIFDINPSILALTLLAWGNSISDLVSNICLAREGDFGIKVAMSGCFAGPMFNVVVGLGICLLSASWNSHPLAFILPDTMGINVIIIFLGLGLVWTMIVTLATKMQLSKTYGITILCLYATFIGTRLHQDLGWVWT